MTNWFIVSLAFADLFVTIPMLFSLYVMVSIFFLLSFFCLDSTMVVLVVVVLFSLFYCHSWRDLRQCLNKALKNNTQNEEMFDTGHFLFSMATKISPNIIHQV